jgi:hypothetical protein
LALAFVISMTAAQSETIELGGVRKVQAVVQADDDNYSVQVQFLAVSCFDQATNREMNLGLGRSFAFQALARRLAGKGNAELVVSGARTTSGEQSGKSFSVILQVPRSGVKVVAKSESAPEAKPADTDTETVRLQTSDAAPLTRKEQYEKMIAQLSLVLHKDIKRARTQAAPAAPATLEALQKKANETFAQLEHEIRDDLELTNLGSDLDPAAKGDKDQLLATLASTREKLLQELNR